MNKYHQPKTVAIVLFKESASLNNNPALSQASHDGFTVAPVMLKTEYLTPEPSDIINLKNDLNQLGSFLFIANSDARSFIPRVMRLTGATTIYWNQSSHPQGKIFDDELRLYLGSGGIPTHIIPPLPKDPGPSPHYLSILGMGAQMKTKHHNIMYWKPSQHTSMGILKSLAPDVNEKMLALNPQHTKASK